MARWRTADASTILCSDDACRLQEQESILLTWTEVSSNPQLDPTLHTRCCKREERRGEETFEACHPANMQLRASPPATASARPLRSAAGRQLVCCAVPPTRTDAAAAPEAKSSRRWGVLLLGLGIVCG